MYFSTTSVRLISAEQTYGLRFKILRPHQSIEACYYDGDHDENNFHLGVFFEEKLVSIGSFLKERHPNIEGQTQYRLRGMATLEDFRNRRAGTAIIHKGEEILLSKNVDTWWCNARVIAAEYYLKLGMTQVGDVYEIKPIGMHKLMYKKLK